MSGFLPDIASWALRGGAGENGSSNNAGGNTIGNSNSNNSTTPADETPLSAEEVRAQRLARMGGNSQQQQQQDQDEDEVESSTSKQQDPEPMDIDTTNNDGNSKRSEVAAKKPVTLKTVAPTPVVTMASVKAAPPSVDQQQHAKKKKVDSASSSQKPSSETCEQKKLQRKKESILKKTLEIVLAGSSSATSAAAASTTTVDTGSTEISVQTIAEILATRLAMTSSFCTATNSSTNNNTTSSRQPSLMTYLSQCHRRASEEVKTLQQQQSSAKQQQSTQTTSQVLLEILQEIQSQVVSYAASCLIEPDLFDAASQDAWKQLAACFLVGATSSDMTQNSITFGVMGAASSSFYYKLCEELVQQDADSVLEASVGRVGKYLCQLLKKCESVLDTTVVSNPFLTDGSVDVSPAILVSALTALAIHKRAAEALTCLDVSSPPTLNPSSGNNPTSPAPTDAAFLLPPADSPEATQIVRPALPAATTASNLLQMLAGVGADQHRPYAKRSGPALERDTLLGLVLKHGVPKNNAAFSPSSILRQSLDSIERTVRQQRLQLRNHQEACHQLIMQLLKSSPAGRERVMTWFMDCLVVNVNAAALRPDPSKVSSTNLLLNTQVVLLKLCEPFVGDNSKQHLIDPGFVSSPAHHKGVFADTGDGALTRLGENYRNNESSNNTEEDGMRVDGGDRMDVDAATTTAATPTSAITTATPSSASKPDVVYNPKNSFIPMCFFLCARSVHLCMGPALQMHQNLVRHISHTHWEISNSPSRDLHTDPHFSILVSRQRSSEVALFQEEFVADTLHFLCYLAQVMYGWSDAVLRTMPEDFVNDICDTVMWVARLKPKMLQNIEFKPVFQLTVKLLSPQYASMVRNYNLRAMLGDVLYELFLPTDHDDRRDVPSSVAIDRFAGGQTYLLSNEEAQETLAPSLLLLYGEVELTGYYDKMTHRAKIASIIKYLWESQEHRPAFRRITQNKESFIKFANGIMNETNTLIATVMQKLPEIREAQEKMKDPQHWSSLNEDQQNLITSRLEDNEREVKSALPLCNKTLQMFGYLNTDEDIRSLFLLEELCPRLVTMLLHVLTKLVGSKGLDLKVDNPEQYDFRPKEMLRDLCAIFALFAEYETFQLECAKSGCDPKLLRSANKTCRKLNLLIGKAMIAFESLPDSVETALARVADSEELLADAPDEFLDEIMSTFMKDPVILPSGHYVDRSTITQHLLNDPKDPFNRKPMTIDDVQPATELKERMKVWLEGEKLRRQTGSG